MKKEIISGVYTITCIKNNKIYVGYSIDILDRFNDHRQALRWKNHDNIYLQRAFNKYGLENFKFEILEEWEKKYLPSFEHYWCTLLWTHNPKYGYNIQPTNPITGINGSAEESIIKRTQTRKKNAKERGYWHSPETRNKIGNAHKGTKMPEDAVIRMRAKLKGRKRSKEEIENAVNARMATGYRHSEETKRKMTISQKNRIFVATDKIKRYWERVDRKRVQQYDRSMNLILQYDCAKSASGATGIQREGIAANCRHNQKENLKKYRTLKGYIWKYN